MNRLSRHLMIVGVAVLLGSQAFAASTIDWLREWPAAQAAAKASHKIVLVYIFQPSHDACVEMDRSTLNQQPVVDAVQEFVPLAISGASSKYREFCEQHKVGVRRNTDKDMKLEFSAIPAYLFLDAEGNEYYRGYGFYPPHLFLDLLKQVSRIITCRQGLVKRPNDARLLADLGHVYLEMEREDLGKPFLQQAVKADPQNAVGARADAELDLCILSIPDDPVAAVRTLVAYRFNNPESKRDFEIKYFMAVAQIAAQKFDQAEKILLDFAAIPPKLNPGTPQEQANPDYTNPWTVRADLLLKQLHDLQANKPAEPKRRK